VKSSPFPECLARRIRSGSDTETDPLSQLAAVATSDLVPGSSSNRLDGLDHGDDPEEDSEVNHKSRLAPNVLTFSYPGADDVDRWLPIALDRDRVSLSAQRPRQPANQRTRLDSLHPISRAIAFVFGVHLPRYSYDAAEGRTRTALCHAAELQAAVVRQLHADLCADDLGAICR